MATWQTTPGARELIVRDTWLSFHPKFHVADPRYWASIQTGTPALAQEAETVARFRSQGWIVLERGTGGWLPAGLEVLFLDLAAFRLPAQFAFIFDELWMPSRRLSAVSRQLLGGACVALPGQWIWPADGATRSGRGDLRPEVLDRTRAGAPGPLSVTYRLALSPSTARDTLVQLRAVRPSAEGGLPRARTRGAGSAATLELRGELIAWDAARWHWDGRSRHESADGLACLEVEHQRRDAEPLGHPQVNPEILPSWEQRIRLIAQVLQTLGSREPAARRLPEAGQQLLDALDRPGTSGVS